MAALADLHRDRESGPLVDLFAEDAELSEDGIAFLEWTSHGTLRDGSDFSYQGVSVLEAESDLIDAFRTYYDTAAFVGH